VKDTGKIGGGAEIKSRMDSILGRIFVGNRMGKKRRAKSRRQRAGRVWGSKGE
jgi:hypothetical protein